MASYYWIKLYDEILDDPKMGRLSDGAFRLAINLFLLAGRQEERDGRLPDVEDIAWTLRLSPETFGQQWEELERAGIVQFKDGDPNVTNFENRQRAVSDAEKQRRYRDRKRQEALQDGYTNVTEGVTESNADRDIEEDTEEDVSPPEPEPECIPDKPRVIRVYENLIAPITVDMEVTVQAAVDLYGEQLVIEAMQTAVESKVRRWPYIQAILENWKREGKGGRESRANGQNLSLWNSQALPYIQGKRPWSELDPAVKKALKDMGGENVKRIKIGFETDQAKKQFLSLITETPT